VIIAVLAAWAMAWMYHVITEHHALIRIRHVFREQDLPQADRHSLWHRTGHGRRLAAEGALTAAGVLAGLAWELSPWVVLVLSVTAGIAAVIVVIMRLPARRYGQQPAEPAAGRKTWPGS